MDLRLSASQEDEATVVHVDGRLAVHGVSVLDGMVGGATGPVILDLTHLQSVDDAGVAALRLHIERGVRLRGTSPYITLLLRSDIPGEKQR
jgi:ABC-type transporter Mla MlaB component